MLQLLGCVLLFAHLSLQQKDPVKDFCRRFSHQTAVIDRKLYLDGGFMNWNPIAQNPSNYTNTWLAFQDLDSSPPSIGEPQLYANLSKNASMPSVSGGILWQDNVNKRFYLYGGEYTNISPNPPNLLSYDVLHDEWDSFGPPNRPVQSVSYGAGVAISELGTGYVFGGWLSNNSVPGWSGGPLATNSLIKYNMDTNDWTNNTGPADSLPRAEGVMVYVPASDDGLLVYFGGVTAQSNGSTLPAPMSLIHLYDIRSSKWYTQTAVGEVPLSRRRFCAGVAWAPDQSSYNIYLYGGLGFGANQSGFDDVYILSMPSFKWIRWWQGSGAGKPHHSLSCNVISGGQMLVIGGTFPLSDQCDSPVTWGTHNLDMGKRSGKMWNVYSPNITSYIVPPEVISVVGGGSLGGANATAPDAGFDNGDLAVYFVQKASYSVRSPTRAIPGATSAPRDSSSSDLTSGAIAGIAIGGAVILIGSLVAGFCFVRRHRKQRSSAPRPPSIAEVAYNPATTYSNSQSTEQSPHTPYAEHGPGTQTRYQLPGDEPPAELDGNSFQLHQDDPKGTIVPHVHDASEYPPSPHQISPLLSPDLSVRAGHDDVGTNPISPYGPPTSPTPTYSSLAKSGRKAGLTNQTYYSP